MKIDLDWIQEELDAGRDVELECVDEKGLLSDYTDSNKELLRGALTVEEVKNHAIYIKNCTVGIVDNEFKHFRIKQYPTFDDLIDVLIKAKKDNIVSRVEIKRNSLNATVNVTDSRITEFCISKDAGDIVIKERIDWIKSLYTETFVIESEEDYNSLKGGANIKLLNGEVIKRIVNYSPRTPEFSDANGRVVRLSYLTLKGATVTQQKGNK